MAKNRAVAGHVVGGSSDDIFTCIMFFCKRAINRVNDNMIIIILVIIIYNWPIPIGRIWPCFTCQ